MLNLSKLNGQAKDLAKASVHEQMVDIESTTSQREEQKRIKTVLILSVIASLLMLGLLAGWTFHRLCISNPSSIYHALCDIPYDGDGGEQPRFYTQDESATQLIGNDGQYNDLVDDNYFREGIELDGGDDDGYAMIEVPIFKNGHHGRFMHDFASNQSAIIDAEYNRCFIMPLDRRNILLPTSFVDYMEKMASGKYNIDMERVRHNMRVVMPRITDLLFLSPRLANACNEAKIYMLEHIRSKRSAESIPGTMLLYAGFMGKGIIEYGLANMAEVQQLESTVTKPQQA